jgi:hypothetical protein
MKVQTNIKAGQVELIVKSSTEVSVKSTLDVSLKAAD